MEYRDLIYGTYSPEQVKLAAQHFNWQLFRESLKGLSTPHKLERLRDWVRTHDTNIARIQVTNYVYALKRGGLL